LRASDAPFVGNLVPPPDEQAGRQLLRVMASDAMRAALQCRFGVTPAFQNCHHMAVFGRNLDTEAYHEFTSSCLQVLNQSPELRSC
jgi:hypothetical protein